MHKVLSLQTHPELYMTIGKLGLGKTLAMVAVLASTFLVIFASAESKARIVRLSDVEGNVQIDRTTGTGFEKAFLNLPMVEGCRLKTGANGRAEVEFEDGSALRLGNDSELEFVHLALGDDGQKISTVRLLSGTAYASLREKKGDRFLLTFAQESITVPDSAHFRVVLTHASSATVAVFKGKVSVASPSGHNEVAEKHSATIDLGNADAVKNDLARSDSNPTDAGKTDPNKKAGVVIARNYDQEPLDGWDRQQNDYHERYTTVANSAFSSPYGYGVSDLNYYGGFMTIPGYGFGWQPYFADASWNPLMDGGWAWYPGAGYMWVSAYPWGWMPYRYGNWNYAPGYGWFWQPGAWGSWHPTPALLNVPARTNVPAAPVSGHETVMVGKGLTGNPVGAPHKLTITPGSAGFGVPRGSVRHLDRVAKTVAHSSQPVVVATQPPPPPPVNTGVGVPTTVPMRSGPSSMSTMPAPSSRRSAPPPSRPH